MKVYLVARARKATTAAAAASKAAAAPKRTSRMKKRRLKKYWNHGTFSCTELPEESRIQLDS